jgi:hypothetical protein
MNRKTADSKNFIDYLSHSNGLKIKNMLFYVQPHRILTSSIQILLIKSVLGGSSQF